ncbi:MAG: CoA pyrophosphatase [Neisseria sp.]|uniref:NUDIX hydrolase n=1 Tax=Neisseria sp. TaxID=192066 RepID=UPI0026DC8C9D|nr:CoA pyrophosphatase [Neisseria sp.]MDO4248440.1 CoA pyrophosphatase [Neisseria sp.]
MQQPLLTRFLQSLGSDNAAVSDRHPNLFGRALADYRQAAVLLAVVWHRHEWQLLLTRRADTLRHHTGQIALAGGRRDPHDSSFTATALREAHEEIGTPPEVWQTFGEMPPRYTPSGYAVHAVPALAESLPALSINPQEVAEVFYVPLTVALNPKNYQTRTTLFQNQARHTPVLPYGAYDIWGLTGLILFSAAERYQFFIKEHPII